VPRASQQNKDNIMAVKKPRVPFRERIAE